MLLLTLNFASIPSALNTPKQDVVPPGILSPMTMTSPSLARTLPSKIP